MTMTMKLIVNQNQIHKSLKIQYQLQTQHYHHHCYQHHHYHHRYQHHHYYQYHYRHYQYHYGGSSTPKPAIKSKADQMIPCNDHKEITCTAKLLDNDGKFFEKYKISFIVEYTTLNDKGRIQSSINLHNIRYHLVINYNKQLKRDI